MRRPGSRRRKTRAFQSFTDKRKGSHGHWTRTRTIWRMRLSSGQVDYYQTLAFSERKFYFKSGTFKIKN